MSELPQCRHGDRLKRSYKSQAKAHQAMVKTQGRYKFRAYKCPNCPYYHLTTQEYVPAHIQTVE